MNNSKHDHDDDPHHAHDNDNGKRAVTPTPVGSALTSLAALGAALNSVDTSTVGGGSGLPMLQFKRDGGGVWSFGQRRTIVEEGSRWAVNPQTFQRGYVCFGAGNKKLGERLVSVSLPMPDLTTLPDKEGFPWVEQWSVNMKCLNGADAGAEVIFKSTTQGGVQSVGVLIEAVRDRINSGQHSNQVAPIVLLEKDNYQHGQYGRVWIPVLSVVDWMPLSGPAPAPDPEPAPPSRPRLNTGTEQPRRRRVG